MRESLGDVGIVGDEPATLDEYAQSRTEFMEICGWNHPVDGVQVLSARWTPASTSKPKNTQLG